MFKSVPQKEKIKTAPYATKDTTGVVSLVSSTCNLSTKMLNEAGLMAPQITRVASKTVINGSVTLLAHSKIRALSHRPSLGEIHAQTPCNAVNENQANHTVKTENKIEVNKRWNAQLGISNRRKKNTI